MNENIDQEYVNNIAKMYAEQILALSMQIADAIAKSAILHGSNISNNADEMGKVISIEAIKKAAKELNNAPTKV